MHRRCRAAALVRSLMALNGALPCRRSARPELPPAPRISREDVNVERKRAITGGISGTSTTSYPTSPTPHRMANERRGAPNGVRTCSNEA
jgi:hypothetical protein